MGRILPVEAGEQGVECGINLAQDCRLLEEGFAEHREEFARMLGGVGLEGQRIRQVLAGTFPAHFDVVDLSTKIIVGGEQRVFPGLARDVRRQRCR